MAKMTKRQIEGCFSLTIIVGLGWLAVKFSEAVGGIRNIVLIALGILAIYVALKTLSWIMVKLKATAKREGLRLKYQDETITERIMNQTLWQGELAEQVKESLGTPEDIDQKVLKTKKKEIWKYGHEGGNRYRLRVTLENDIVVGWDQR